MELNSQKGQTLVEYVLLIVVAILLVLTIYRSEAFRRIFGEQGLLGKQIKSQNEYTYRHAGPKRDSGTEDISRTNKEGGIHPSYADPDGNGTRFFGPKKAYP